MQRFTQTIEDRMKRRIVARGKGSVFTASDFLDLASRNAVDVSFHRLTTAGILRRVARGLYLYPKKDHPLLGELGPSIEALVEALAARDHVRLQPTGAYAANMLRLSDQVPAKVVFVTDGRARKINIGKLVIEFRHTTPKRMIAGPSGLVISALRYLGKAHIYPERIAHLRAILSCDDRKRLLVDLPSAPVWLHSHLRAIAGEDISRVTVRASRRAS
jgi:hypothetical protein